MCPATGSCSSVIGPCRAFFPSCPLGFQAVFFSGLGPWKIVQENSSTHAPPNLVPYYLPRGCGGGWPMGGNEGTSTSRCFPMFFLRWTNSNQWPLFRGAAMWCSLFVVRPTRIGCPGKKVETRGGWDEFQSPDWLVGSVENGVAGERRVAGAPPDPWRQDSRPADSVPESCEDPSPAATSKDW